MKKEEIKELFRHEYTAKCEKCGKTITVLTQGEDNCPEYWADVYVKCDCGNFVLLSLPVN